MSFYIDEDKIGEYARDLKCKSFLVVYYAVTNDVIMPFIFVNNQYKFKFNLSDKYSKNAGYGLCSLYGWLCDSKESHVITSSHRALRSFPKFCETNKLDGNINDYTCFIDLITIDMFEEIN